jgi:hypothetical protein
MPAADLVLLAGGGQLLQRQLADRLEHAEARAVDPDQVLLGEGTSPSVAADEGAGGRGPPAREHAEPREHGAARAPAAGRSSSGACRASVR